MPWQARTFKHILVDEYGMDATANPTAQCACGVIALADVLVDITPLPIGIRKALGLEFVDHICDGCQTRLFRELHISEEEFYRLLGAPDDALISHRERDTWHGIGCERRPDAHKPKHPTVTMSQMSGKRLSQVEVTSPIPLARRRRSHDDVAFSVHSDLQNEVTLNGFDPIVEVLTKPVDVLPVDEPTQPDLSPVVESNPIIVDDDPPADLPLISAPRAAK